MKGPASTISEGNPQSSICAFLKMYIFTNVRPDIKMMATVRHSTPTATSRSCDEGGSVKLGCCPGGGVIVGVVKVSIPAGLAIALFCLM